MNIFTSLFRKKSPCTSNTVNANIPAAAAAKNAVPPVAPENAPAVDGDLITVYDGMGKAQPIHRNNAVADGREGKVYSLPKRDDVLVKLYKPALLNDADKLEQNLKRLTAMCKIRDQISPRCTTAKKSFAWPVTLVFDRNRQIIGFGMCKCDGVSFRTLGNVKKIQQYFSRWTRRELALTALDFVRKLKFLYSHGVLVNDFNPSNFLVDENCNVSFIDCDSFQITYGNETHITRTYIASHCAPELLKNKPLLTTPRNIHHLEFGAAITIFNLLMCGLHPYAYHDPSGKTICGNPEENLLNGRCPLGVGAGCKFPVGNWYNLWSWISHNAKGGFIKTFQNGHSDPAMRTTLDEWEGCLIEMISLMNKYPERSALFPLVPNPAAMARKSSSYNGKIYQQSGSVTGKQHIVNL